MPDSAEGPVEIRNIDPPSFDTGGVPWWDPEADASVQPGVDAVLIDGVAVSRDSLVRLHPSRRADAQDLFFAEQSARVSAVLSDVDGNIHVAVTLLDDPGCGFARLVRPLSVLRTRRARTVGLATWRERKR
ncbi:MAG: hypothetical protein WKF73_17280 [Nocardioidaceae bacterium]